MIDAERWAQALGVENASVGVRIAEVATAILHKDENDSVGTGARLMRLVYENAPSDLDSLLETADGIEAYAEKLSLPLYASCTPNGRLVANICAFSPFDETDEVVDCLHQMTQELTNDSGRSTQ